MKKAKIYIETTLKGPTVKDGAYAAVLEFICRGNVPFTKKIYGMEEDTTYHRSTLLAMLMALRCFDKGKCEIEIITGDVFVANAIKQKRPAEWSRQEWKNSKKKDVVHKDLWQQFLEEMDKHEITVTLRKTNAYSKDMVSEMRRRLKKDGKTSGDLGKPK